MEYNSEAERKLFNPRTLSEIEAEMGQRGFKFMGHEGLTQFKYKDGLFKTEQFKTKEQVLKEYQENFGKDVEVELVDEEGLSEGQQAVLVFAKKKENL